ncbi:ferric reductase-like transmembrane domain-containing protein [Jatrophihabitans sp. YIM 134969]
MLIWYTARGAGFAALVLLTLATAGGALQSSRRLSPTRRVVLQYAHRAGAVAGLIVVTLHVATIIADSYAGVGLLGALVPGASGYRPWQVALGTVAVYGFVAVAALGAARRRMARSERGSRLWRGVHLLAYPCWAAAVLHGMTAGTDAGRAWAVALTVACVAAVVVAVGYRLAEPRLATVPVRARTLEVSR